jgi:uracil-DNA glycosylase
MIAAQLPAIPSFEVWRDKARALLVQGIAPEGVVWTCGDAMDLFGGAPLAPAPSGSAPAHVSRAFMELARKAVLHRDAERFALLYRILWRLQRERALMEDRADPDVIQLHALAKAVRRDEHKMHAFVRFREISSEDGAVFVAWFEPQHHIVKETADFFVRRFANMRWSILTPETSAHWDGVSLRFGPGATAADAPREDARDDDWRVYYENMFNPARLNTAAMTREMPKHYWRNLPEAASIPSLLRTAGGRTETMVSAMPTIARKRAGAAHAKIAPEDLPASLERVAEHATAPASFAELNRALTACRACPLWKNATQAVPGEGRLRTPTLALVGEQPGDQEDLAGRPFVGPAGAVLDKALDAAGIDRGEIFVTNAVKHFKHEPRGKRRLHKRPDRAEIEICRWWVGHELRLAKPALTLALGATALQSLSAHKGSLESARGRLLQTREGAPLMATVHPSYILRIPDADDKAMQLKRFIAELKAAKKKAAHLLAAA